MIAYLDCDTDEKLMRRENRKKVIFVFSLIDNILKIYISTFGFVHVSLRLIT